MSNIFSKYRKELAGVKVLSADKVWKHTSTGKPYLDPKYNVIGKVDSAFPNFVLKANKLGFKTGYIEDTSALTKTTKERLVEHFYDKKGKRTANKVAYLVREDNKKAGGSGVVKNKK